MDLERAYNRLMREELWLCMRESGAAGKFVRLVQDMYESSITVVRCTVGVTDGFKVEEDCIKDHPDEVRQESL